MRLFALLALLPVLLAAPSPSPEPYNPFFPAPLDPYNETAVNLTLLDARPDRSVPVYLSGSDSGSVSGSASSKIANLEARAATTAGAACHVKRDDEGHYNGKKVRTVPKKIKRKGLASMSPRSPLPHPNPHSQGGQGHSQPGARAAVCKAKVKRQDPVETGSAASMAMQGLASSSSSTSSASSASSSPTSTKSAAKSCRARPTASSSSASLARRSKFQPPSQEFLAKYSHGSISGASHGKEKRFVRKVKRANSTCKPKPSSALPNPSASASAQVPSSTPSSSAASASASISSIVSASTSQLSSAATASSSTMSSSAAIPSSSSSSAQSSSAAAPSSSAVPTSAATSSTSSVAPVPTSSAAPAPAPFTVDTEGNGPFQGQATYYDTDVGYGACGKWHKNSEATAAASWDLFDNWPGYNGLNPNVNPICGQRLRVSYQGKSVVVEIQDRCPGCSKRWLDLSAGAFQQLADKDVGFLGMDGYTPGLTWEWVAPTTPLPQNLPFTL